MKKIKISEIIDGIESQTDELNSYFNTSTGEIVNITFEDFYAAESQIDITTFPKWQQDSVNLAKEIIFSDDYIGFPTPYEINEYKIMKTFSFNISDEILSEIFLKALKGKGAFKRFKNLLIQYNLREQWFTYRTNHLTTIAKDWCDRNKIEYIE